jgi:hypothetical protein
MKDLLRIDWNSVFVPTVSLAEIVLRGTLVYLLLFLLMRLLRREAGTLGISDLLVVVLIADTAQNAMSSDYKSVTEGAVLVGTIIAWDYSLDWLGYKFPALGRRRLEEEAVGGGLVAPGSARPSASGRRESVAPFDDAAEEFDSFAQSAREAVGLCVARAAHEQSFAELSVGDAA